MSSLEDLYREVVLDHYRNPRHRNPLDRIDASADGNNPLCGDKIHLDLTLEGNVVAAVSVTGQGCSISQSSASMMSEAVVGKSRDEIAVLTRQFKAMMAIEGNGEEPVLDPDRPGSVLGDLEALQGVRKFPVRIKCADLGWTTLQEALDT